LEPSEYRNVRGPTGPREESDQVMTIILKDAPKTGWSPANGLLQRGDAMICATCGAVCDESATDDHDAWHAALDLKTLPEYTDYVTDIAEVVSVSDSDSEPVSYVRSAKDAVRLPKLQLDEPAS
jgi:hypothetical protein